MTHFKRGLTEFVGTFWLVLGGSGAALLAVFRPEAQLGLMVASLLLASTVLAMAYGSWRICGCHLNPAVSIGLWASRRLPARELGLHLAGQALGAVAGAGTLTLVASSMVAVDMSTGAAARGPRGDSLATLLMAEVMLTALVLLVVLGTSQERRPMGLASIAIGLGLTLTHLIGVPLSSLSIRSAGSEATLIVSGTALQQIWLLWGAAVVGALLGGLSYRWLGRSAAPCSDGQYRPVDTAVRDGNVVAVPRCATPIER